MTEREIFFEAVEIAAAEARAAYLQGACGQDVTLRRKVEELLKEHFSNDSLLAGPALEEGPAGIVESPLREAHTRRIGRYKLLEKIGEGGMGEVWMVEQEKPVGRRAALKLIKMGMESRSAIARFEAEGQALALMDHPNIARVFDSGATDTGRPYLVMELVRGIKITEYCDRYQLSTHDRLELFIKVCQAIQHAHQKGVIHRDLKPSNVLVTINDGEAVPKLIDFGIAKAMAQKLTDKTLFTEFQALVGTPAYMSPEQVDLSSVDTDTRSNIYSLGVLLYELLVGQPPFDGTEMMREGLDSMRRVIREKDPQKPSTKLKTLRGAELTSTAQRRRTDAVKLTHLLSGDLDWIVMKCLEKDRARRYETANGLAADLNRYLDNEPVVARPPSATYRLQKAFQRHRVPFLAAAAVAAALVLGLAGSLWQVVRATRAEALASRRLAEAEGISAFLIEVFQSPDPTRNGRTITVAETLDIAAKRLESDLAGEAIPLLKQAHDHHLAAQGPQHPDTLAAMYPLGLAYSEAGRLDEAIRLQEDLLARRRRLNGPESPEAIVAMLSLANSYSTAQRAEDALALRQESLRLSRKVNGPVEDNPCRAVQAANQFLPGLVLMDVMMPGIDGGGEPAVPRVMKAVSLLSYLLSLIMSYVGCTDGWRFMSRLITFRKCGWCRARRG